MPETDRRVLAPDNIRTAARNLLSGFSVEMTGKDVHSLLEAREVLPAGTRVNITFLGSEDTADRVAAAAAAKGAGFVPVPHIAARRVASRRQLASFLDRLEDAAACDHLFCVGGDPASPQGPYSSALDVIRTGILPGYGVREVSVAGYPEGHPYIPDAVLWRSLEEKAAALADQGIRMTVITQFGFDAAAAAEWVRRARAGGIRGRIRVGVAGPAGARRLLGFARRLGISANAMIVKKYGLSLTNLMGTAGPDRFIADLASQLLHAPGDQNVRLHIYTFGGIRATALWAQDRCAGAHGAASPRRRAT